jgi:hypothetical protein
LCCWGLWLFCLIDVITTDESNMRNLPKLVWVPIVLFLFDIGSILWLVAGRNWQTSGGATQSRGAGNAFPEYDGLGVSSRTIRAKTSSS